jgi:hypothetical protein
MIAPGTDPQSSHPATRSTSAMRWRGGEHGDPISLVAPSSKQASMPPDQRHDINTGALTPIAADT